MPIILSARFPVSIELTGKNPPTQPLKVNPAAKAVGSSIPVSKNCVISVSATGDVTQKGIKKLIDYLNLIKDAFPETEESEQPN